MATYTISPRQVYQISSTQLPAGTVSQYNITISQPKDSFINSFAVFPNPTSPTITTWNYNGVLTALGYTTANPSPGQDVINFTGNNILGYRTIYLNPSAASNLYIVLLDDNLSTQVNTANVIIVVNKIG